METRKFKDLTIRDAFMFAAVMSDPEICRRVLELALGIPISEVHIQTEKTMAYHSEYHGVRLDVYAADADRTRFNVEMQVTLQKFLPKRSRYYHDQIDDHPPAHRRDRGRVRLYRPELFYKDLPRDQALHAPGIPAAVCGAGLRQTKSGCIP